MFSLTSSGIGVTTAVASLMLLPIIGTTQPETMPADSAWVNTYGGNMVSLAAGGTASGAQSTSDIRSSKEAGTLVADLKAESGLTADQLGRLLGVTRRSIHNWAAGSTIAPKHESRIRALSDMVFSLEATSPEARRALLLDSTSGPSPFGAFLDSAPRSQRIQHPIPVSERFDS